jgi:hypothetical protein
MVTVVGVLRTDETAPSGCDVGAERDGTAPEGWTGVLVASGGG